MIVYEYMPLKFWDMEHEMKERLFFTQRCKELGTVCLGFDIMLYHDS